MENGIFGLIKVMIADTYPISFITLVGATFGAYGLAYPPRRARIKSLERQLGIRDVK